MNVEETIISFQQARDRIAELEADLANRIEITNKLNRELRHLKNVLKLLMEQNDVIAILMWRHAYAQACTDIADGTYSLDENEANKKAREILKSLDI